MSYFLSAKGQPMWMSFQLVVQEHLRIIYEKCRFLYNNNFNLSHFDLKFNLIFLKEMAQFVHVLLELHKEYTNVIETVFNSDQAFFGSRDKVNILKIS